MSKFIDKLKQVSQVAPQAMGFKVTPAAPPRPRMLLVASLAGADIDDLAQRVAGVDGGLLDISGPGAGVKTLRKVLKVVPDIPWGGWLKGGGGGMGPLVKAGCDFVVFPLTTPLATLQDGEIGRVLQVEESLSESLVPAIDDLPVDAVLVTGGQKEHFLTWKHLMVFQYFAGLLSKPLLVSVASTVADSELQALWEAGVDGVVVEVETAQPVARLSELRQLIDGLTLPSYRKLKKTEAILPYIGGGGDTVIDDEDEE